MNIPRRKFKRQSQIYSYTTYTNFSLASYHEINGCPQDSHPDCIWCKNMYLLTNHPIHEISCLNFTFIIVTAKAVFLTLYFNWEQMPPTNSCGKTNRRMSDPTQALKRSGTATFETRNISKQTNSHLLTRIMFECLWRRYA